MKISTLSGWLEHQADGITDVHKEFMFDITSNATFPIIFLMSIMEIEHCGENTLIETFIQQNKVEVFISSTKNKMITYLEKLIEDIYTKTISC